MYTCVHLPLSTYVTPSTGSACLSVCLCLCASPGSSDPVHPTCTRCTPAVQFSNILRWHTLVCPPLTARSFLQPGSYVPGLILLPSLLSTIYIQSVLILHFLMSQRNIPLTQSSLTPTLHLPICRLLFKFNDEWFAVDGIGGWAQECRYISWTSQDRRGKVASVLYIFVYKHYNVTNCCIPSYQSI